MPQLNDQCGKVVGKRDRFVARVGMLRVENSQLRNQIVDLALEIERLRELELGSHAIETRQDSAWGAANSRL